MQNEPHSCERCGDFAPLQTHLGRHWCQPCLERRDPIELDPPTFINLVRDSVTLTLRVAGPAVVLAVLLGLPTHVLAHLEQHATALSFAYSITFGLLLRASLQRLAFLEIVQPERAVLRRALRDAYAHFWPALTQMVIGGLICIAWTFLFIAPGMARFLSYEMSLSLVMNERASAAGALEQSRARMFGHRTAAFVAYLPLTSPMLITFVVTVALTLQRMEQHLPLTTDVGPASHVLGGLLLPILGVPAELLGVVLHLKLAQPHDSDAALLFDGGSRLQTSDFRLETRDLNR